MLILDKNRQFLDDMHPLYPHRSGILCFVYVGLSDLPLCLFGQHLQGLICIKVMIKIPPGVFWYNELVNYPRKDNFSLPFHMFVSGLGEHAHFKNFGMAFLTLFRVATGDNWNGIMKDTLRKDCDHDADCVQNCCVSPVIAPIFFVIFVLMAQFVLVNVVVAVLMKHLEESHKHLEDEQDMDNQLEREFQEKQELEERRGMCLALQMDSECLQQQHKPLTKVLSLPSNFTYNPPGTKKMERQPSTRSHARRQTLHSQQPIMLSNLEDIRNIDESISDIQSVRANLDEIITVISPVDSKPLKKINEDFLLAIPVEQKPMYKLYGSTKHLFVKQKSMEVTEETPFLLAAPPRVEVEVSKSSDEDEDGRMPKHDSQESVERIISERRMLDDNFKDVKKHDIFDVTRVGEEKIKDGVVSEKDQC